MKDLLLKIWKDPVWGAIIASVIFAILCSLYSLIAGWFSDTESISDVFKVVFSYKINIWLAAALFIVILLVVRLIKTKRENRIPVPPFVNDFTRWQYQNQIWKWRWEWSPTNKFYYVTDLNIECPNCHEGVLDLETMYYRCPKCNTFYEFAWINGNPEGVRKQILEDARKKYGDWAKYLGNLKA